MANAKAEITLYSVVDISKVTRYYILKSSTASAPSAPTTNPPSGWTTTEPTYTSGSTNTLYFVDLTEFTNSTFKYSAVSKSSSYEAAKAAYNKAIDAAKTATNFMDFVPDTGLIVGDMTTSTLGKNVLIDSDGVDIRDGEEIVAEFTKDTIKLGCDGSNTKIDLCSGTGEISTDTSWWGNEFGTLGIKGNNGILLYTTNILSMATSYEKNNVYWGYNFIASAGAPWHEDRDIRDRSSPVSMAGDFCSYRSNTDEISIEIEQRTDGLVLSHEYSDKDSYMETASITIKGGYYDDLRSSITLDAGEISMLGDVSITASIKLNNIDLGVMGCAYTDNDTNKNYPGLVRPDGNITKYIRTSEAGLLPYKSGGSSKLGTNTWPFNAGYFKDVYLCDGTGEIESVFDVLTDLSGGLGWTTAVLGGSFKAYDNKSANTPKYRSMGRIVNVKGVVTPTSTLACKPSSGSGFNSHIICTLPDGYRPSTYVYSTCEGSNGNNWMCSVSPEGNVYFARYRNAAGEWVDASTSTWLPFNMMFTID